MQKIKQDRGSRPILWHPAQDYLRNMAQSKPIRIGITWGDPNGVGSECILKAFEDDRMMDDLVPVVFGHAETLRQQATQFKVNVDIREVDDAGDAKPGSLSCVNISDEFLQPDWGQPQPKAGEFARLSLEAAVEGLTGNKVDVIVTAPINKDTIQSGQFKFPGHTEYLADKAGVKDVLMILASDTLRVGVVTGHVPLKDVASTLTKDRIVKHGTMLSESLERDFGIASPRIAVLGLNPHAGDNGLIGEEEKTTIIPAVRAMHEKGIQAHGPFGADGFFGSGDFKHFDGVLAMYHDQGLVPFKSLSFGQGVNFTAGLPVVRTSPDHGTAFDIAGKGEANGRSFRAACWMAADVQRQRVEHREMTSSPLKIPKKRDSERERF